MSTTSWALGPINNCTTSPVNGKEQMLRSIGYAISKDLRSDSFPDESSSLYLIAPISP